MKIEVQRISREDDLERAFSIRKDVFVKEQKVPENEEYDEFETSSIHYLALAGGEAVGTARWRKTDEGFKLERFAVLKSSRNKGVGGALLQQILADVLEENKEKDPIYLHAQVTAIPFYTGYNFKTTGNRFVECDIAHFKMEYAF